MTRPGVHVRYDPDTPGPEGDNPICHALTPHTLAAWEHLVDGWLADGFDVHTADTCTHHEAGS